MAKAKAQPASLSVAAAKAEFSAVVAQVERRRLPIVISRRGKPIVQIAPLTRTSVSSYGYMAGCSEEAGDIVSPTGEEWRLSQ